MTSRAVPEGPPIVVCGHERKSESKLDLVCDITLIECVYDHVRHSRYVCELKRVVMCVFKKYSMSLCDHRRIC